MVKELPRHECFIAGIFYFPNTPDENCECRKPSTKMPLDAARKDGIDLSRS